MPTSAAIARAVAADPPAPSDPPEVTSAPVFDVHLDGHLDLTAFAGFQPERRLLPRGWLSVTARSQLAPLHWRGASFFAQYYAFEGENGSQVLRDYEGFSNLDADPFAHFGEVSLDWQIVDHLRTRIGRLDANSDFALPLSTELFHHPSAGLSGAFYPLPTYPNPELGALAAWQAPGPLKRLTMTGAVFFGPEPADLPDRLLTPGRMWIGQVAAGNDETPGRLFVGAWRHTGRFVLNEAAIAADVPAAAADLAASAGWFMRGEHIVGHFKADREFVVSLQFSRAANDVTQIGRESCRERV